VVHTRKLHVALGDVDAARVIYFAAVFRWHEYSFSEWLAAQFMPLSKIFATGFGLPIVESSATYLVPIRQDDHVTLQSWVSDISASSFTFCTTMNNEGTEAGTVKTRHVWVQIAPDGSFARTDIPADFRTLLQVMTPPSG
jgi:YbgC/YbaW family acyl-CoA thioester hydrolase